MECALPSALLNVSVIQLTCPSWSWVILRWSVTPVVTKVAQLPFDGRWCAYLAIDHIRGGDTDD
jgi:hypothetical protein